MPTYITLYKLTDQGAKSIKDAPARIRKGIQAFEAAGGKLIGFYAVMGQYDYIGIGEGPNDETAVALSLANSSLGFAKTTTLRAFTVDEFSAIVQKLP